MKYKVGDKVRIISDLEKKDDVASEMLEYKRKVATITGVYHNGCYKIDLDNSEWLWGDKMFEGKENMFTKDDLKTGMVVENRNGYKYLVLRGNLTTVLNEIQDLMFVCLNGKSYICGNHFTHDLLSAGYGEQFDIIKVYSTEIVSFNSLGKESRLQLIWERGEKHIITLDGEEIELSHESYLAFKKQFSK